MIGEPTGRDQEVVSALLETVDALVVLLDAEGRVLEFNRACREATGWRSEEVVGRPFWDVLLPPEDRAAQWDGFRRLVVRGGTSRDRNVWVARDGARRTIDWSNRVLHGPDGKVTVLAAGTDVSARLRSEQQVRDILENLDDVVWSQDAATRQILYMSPSMARLYGIPVEEFARDSRVWLDVVHPEDRERVDHFVPTLRREGRVSLEYRIVRRDGETRWVHDRAWAVRDGGGGALRYDGLVTDITERRRLQDQLHQAQKMEAVGRIAGGVAHDFNNLLTVVSGYASLLQARLPSDSPLRKQAQEIRKAADRASGLTSQLLAFSRRQVLAPRRIDLNRMLEELEGILRRVMGERVAVRMALSPGMGAVRVDPGQLQQVLLNLAINARDAMPEGGTFALSTRSVQPAPALCAELDLPPGRYVRLAVADTGVGMDEPTRSRVFEPFFTTKEHGGGTGLGLSTVYGIVRQSGGGIRVESAPGRGATFELFLPEIPAAESSEPAAPPAHPSLGTETLLLAEDDDVLRELATEILSAHGYQVLSAHDGEAALGEAARHSGAIHLLVADVLMPGMGGPELARRLRLARPGMRVLWVSGYPRADLEAGGACLGDDPFLPKPFGPEELASRVRALLDEGPR